MQRIDLTKNGGFPFTQNALAFMQNSYTELFAAIGRCYGSKTIIAGMEVGGSSIAEGWLVYEGEIIKFTACAIDAKISISETLTSVEFEDGLMKAAYKVKTAVCDGNGDFDFSELKRAAPFTIDKKNEYDSVWLVGDVKEIDCNNAYRDIHFDSTGLGRLERIGWAICNGNNGTKNRGGRISIGYSQEVVDANHSLLDNAYNVLGGLVGVKKHLLTETEIPLHDHDTVDEATFGSYRRQGVQNDEDDSIIITFPGSGYGNTSSTVIGTPSAGNSTGATDFSGANFKTGKAGSSTPQAHENRQPSIVTLFIQKI